MSKNGISYQELCGLGVAWYRKHGKYPERVVRDADGVEYVVGDWSWVRTRPSKPEAIDHHISRYFNEAMAINKATK